MVCSAVSHHMTRHPLGDGDQLPVHHQHPVIVSPDEALDDHAAAVLLGQRERGAHLRGVGQVDRDPAAMVGVVRLDHDRVADLGGGPDRVFLAGDERLLGHRQSQVRTRILLVSSLSEASSTAMCGGAAGDRGLDPLLMPAVPELDQALRVEPDPGNTALASAAWTSEAVLGPRSRRWANLMKDSSSVWK